LDEIAKVRLSDETKAKIIKAIAGHDIGAIKSGAGLDLIPNQGYRGVSQRQVARILGITNREFKL
jgi:hypothetical protein